jgi:hypothetical protein
MKKLVLLFVLSLLFVAPLNAKTHSEAEYVNHYCTGKIEFLNSDRTRTDCLMPMYSEEYDFARKWYECVTQAMHYAILNNNLPKCVLIIENPINDGKYVERAKRLIKTYNLPVALETRGVF